MTKSKTPTQALIEALEKAFPGQITRTEIVETDEMKRMSKACQDFLEKKAQHERESLESMKNDKSNLNTLK